MLYLHLATQMSSTEKTFLHLGSTSSDTDRKLLSPFEKVKNLLTTVQVRRTGLIKRKSV